MKTSKLFGFALLLALSCTAQAQQAPRARPAAKAVTKPAPVHQAPVPLGEVEVAAAEKVFVGMFPCEFGTFVTVQRDESQPGYFYLYFKKNRYHMATVLTSTGAVRLEDRSAGLMWLQVANKSMLMNQKLGRRLVDACMNPDQIETQEALHRNDTPTLFQEMGVPKGAMALKH